MPNNRKPRWSKDKRRFHKDFKKFRENRAEQELVDDLKTTFRMMKDLGIESVRSIDGVIDLRYV